MKKIIAGIFLFVTILGLSFISVKDIKAQDAACYQCKCTSFSCGINQQTGETIPCGEECAVFAVRSGTECTRDACTSHGFCSRFPVVGRAVYPVNEYPACSGNKCSDACVNSGGGGGGGGGSSSCTLRTTPAVSASCASCLINVRSWAGTVAWVKAQAPGNDKCTDQEAVSHLCNGGVNGDLAVDCVSGKNSDACKGPCLGILPSASPTSTPTNTPTPTVTVTAVPTAVPTASPTASPTPIPAFKTIAYRYSDSLFLSSSAKPDWTDYTQEPTSLSYKVKNPKQGQTITIFAQFKDEKGNLSPVIQKSIKYIGPEPKIINAVCQYDPSGAGTSIIIKGFNLGSEQGKGTVALPAEKLDVSVLSWGDEEASSSADLTTIKSRIATRVDSKLAEGKHKIVVTTNDGRIAEGACNLGLTTVDFTQKTACLAKSANLATDNVAVDITEKADKAKSVIKTKIKTDADGKPVGFTPKLEIGKSYILTIRAPKTVSRKVEFIAEEGTTNLDDIILPVGDIYPVASPDNKVNAFDKGEMTREWSLITDVTRAADLNNDSRVNSVDYSCLQNNYNKSGD